MVATTVAGHNIALLRYPHSYVTGKLLLAPVGNGIGPGGMRYRPRSEMARAPAGDPLSELRQHMDLSAARA